VALNPGDTLWLPWSLIEGAPPRDVAVSVDDAPVPPPLVGVEQRVDPGKRRIAGQRGTEVVRQEVTLQEGELERVVLTFEAKPVSAGPVREGSVLPAPAQRPPSAAASAAVDESNRGKSQRLFGWVGLGLGAAGIAVGATAGIIVASKYSGLKPDCPEHSCDPASVGQGSLDTYNTLRTVSLVGFIGGGVGAAAGATLLLTSPKRRDAEVALWVGPGSAGLWSAF
jgi:hypothetical protein